MEAIQSLFSSIPDDTGASFVVIQHLSPDFDSHMADILQKSTGMVIETVKDSIVINPNTIYLLQPGKEMVLSGGTLFAHNREAVINMPINTFFNSMGADMKANCMAIVLSGTGGDGSKGIQRVSDLGGMVLAQSPRSAKFDSMPLEAISTGFVDFVLDPLEIADEITRFINTPSQEVLDSESDKEIPYQDIILLLRKESNIDFSLYKQPTIKRRIQRRLNILEIDNYRNYLDRLSMDPVELDALFHDILIGVTAFFRDPDAFKTLYENTIIPLVSNKSDGDDIRVWVPACATGEEAYTIAILFHEAFNQTGIQPNLKIFASDIHKRSLEIASNGMYSNVEGIEEDILRKYFIKMDEKIFQVIPRVRQSVVFLRHDVISNPPFTNIDLISCRNLFIYLKANVQQRVLASFMFSLKPGGNLILGASETAGAIGKEFQELDNKWRIYQRPKEMIKIPKSVMSHMIPSLLSSEKEVGIVETKTRSDKDLMEAYDMLLSSFIPRGILVNSELQVIHLFGKAGDFLHQRSGRVSNDLSSMVDGDLIIAMKAGISQSKKEGKRMMFRGVKSTINEYDLLDITVIPLARQSADHYYFIKIETNEDRTAPPTRTSELSEGANDRMIQLEAELQESKEMLQKTVEESEARNEELLSANEEMQSTNEELNSLNEELNSMNEELYSLNTENNERIKTLTSLTNDLNNMMRATEVGLIFISKDMNIRKFTPQVRKLFNIIETDIGRPVNHITYNLADDQFMERIMEVMESGENREREVKTNSGSHYLEKVLPYYDDANQIAGAVLSYVDISRLKHSEIRFQGLFEQTPIPTAFTDVDGRVINMNPAMEGILTEPEDIRAGKSIFDYDLFSDALQDRMAQDIHLQREVEIGPHTDMIVNDTGMRWMSMELSPIVKGDRAEDNTGYIILFQDITSKMEEHKFMEDSLDEKTLMLQEVHHRVKNNLATVNSLLAMQSMGSKDPLVIKTLQEAETRIFVLSTIHEELYRAERLDSIKASNFFQKLVHKIVDLFDIETEVNFEIDNGLELTDTYAIPLGLAVNELVINCMLHAFGDIEHPKIDLTIHQEDGYLNLVVKDNGCGVQDDSKIGGSCSLGTRLINQLVTRQLKGTIEHHNDDGMLWDIRVPF